MASTRKVNNPIDYAIEQNVNRMTNEHMTMKSYGVRASCSESLWFYKVFVNAAQNPYEVISFKIMALKPLG